MKKIATLLLAFAFICTVSLTGCGGSTPKPAPPPPVVKDKAPEPPKDKAPDPMKDKK